MGFTKEDQHYHSFATFLHWLMALLLIFMVGLGVYMHDLEDADPARFVLYQLHKSIGISILALAVVRLLWRLAYRPTFRDHHFSQIERLGSKAVHFAFYFLMFALPISGWVMVSSSEAGIPTRIFGLFTLPDLPVGDSPARASIHENSRGAHEALAIIAASLLLLHVLAALKHHYMNKDNVLVRMVPRMSGQWPGYFVALFFAVIVLSFVMMSSGLVVSGAAQPAAVAEEPASAEGDAAQAAPALRGLEWPGTLVLDESHGQLSFEWYQPDTPEQGRFSGFKVHLNLSEGEPPAHRLLDVDIAMADPAVGSEEALVALNSNEWFFPAQYPLAHFRSASVVPAGEAWRVAGDLEIRGTRRPVEFDLIVEERDDGLTGLKGEFELQRQEFDVGIGDWSSEEYVAYKVMARFDLAYDPEAVAPEPAGPEAAEPEPASP